MLVFWLVFLALNIYFAGQGIKNDSPFALLNLLVAAWCAYNLFLLAK